MAKALRQALEEKLARLKDWGSDEEEEDIIPLPDGAEPSVVDAAAAPAISGPSSVVYLGHIPHGFYENEMQGFFSQFGDVQAIKLSRSKHTARSKGYAFIKFSNPQVAQIVAETMDKYMIYEKQLVCHVIPAHKIHGRMFGHVKRFRRVPFHKMHRDRYNKDQDNQSAERVEKHEARIAKKTNKKRARLEALGIDYELPGQTDPPEDAEQPAPCASKSPTPTRKRKAKGAQSKASQPAAVAAALTTPTPNQSKRQKTKKTKA